MNKVSIKAKIVEVEANKVILRCLIDEEKKYFQTRRFDKEIFLDVIPLEKNTFVKIDIITSPGKREFIFSHITEDLLKEFESKNYFETMSNSAFYQ